MKKTLVALAALASVSAFAQSTVSITGLVDMGYGKIDYKGNAVNFSSLPNGSATSNFTFLISEDLGGGLKADARWEIDPDLTQTVGKTSGTTATGTTSNVTSFLGNGYSFLGLSGGFGEIKFGTINFATLSANGDGNLGFGTAIGSGYRVSSFDAVRAQNALRYDTPTMNGFSASYLLSEKNDLQGATLTTGQTGNQVNQTEGRDKVSEIALAYSNGPLSARYAAMQTEQWGKTATTTLATGSSFVPLVWTPGTGAVFKLNTLSIKYDVTPAMSVAYFNQIAKSDALVGAAASTTGLTLSSTASAMSYTAVAATTNVYDRKTNGVAATYTVGATKFMANYQTVANGDSATKRATSRAGESAKVLGLGVDYSVSKRTTVYARYEKDTDSANDIFRDVATGGYTATNHVYTATAVGIRHTF